MSAFTTIYCLVEGVLISVYEYAEDSKTTCDDPHSFAENSYWPPLFPERFDDRY
jgi:hypothetical protein